MFSKFLITAASLFAFAGLTSAYETHDVFVGGDGTLKFTPECINAAVGDHVRFTFGVKNHTVTQSSFDSPCSPFTDAQGMHSGFFSGYMPVAAGETNLPQFEITVYDEKPIWAYCQQGNHCSQGMVFAVNAPWDPNPKSFNNWKALAMSSAPAPAPVAATTTADVATTPAYVASDSYASPTTSAANLYETTTPAASSAAATGSSIPYPDVITVTQTVTVATATWTTVYGSYPGSIDATPNPEPVVHKVIVGGTEGNIFQPASISAKPKDIVQFEFHSKNHTVTQSSFKAPCTKKEGGFDSSFVPTAVDATVFTSWNITVNDTQPIWAFCAQANHCQSGMVFSVNPVETSDVNQQSFESSARALAANSPSTTSGGLYGSSAASPSTTASSNDASARFDLGVRGLIGTALLGGLIVLL